MANPDPKQPAPTATKPADESIKETIESIVIAFILAFVFRAYVVEAFVIPTGSMAPTLLGEHVRVRSDQSGYNFAIDRSIRSSKAIDPMTYAPIEYSPGIRAGDRILVQKYIYAVAEPRRWDVVVFKAPHDPVTNYIKRLVGLPNEELLILDGNIYTRPTTGGLWTIARKTDRPRVQRAVWQPIYHSQFIPLDHGLDRPEGYQWAVPWVPQGPTAQEWQLVGRRSYRFESDSAGRIDFDFALGGYDTGAAMYPYNQPSAETDPIEDVRIAATFQPDAPGLSVKLSTTARLHGSATIDTLAVEVDATGNLTLTSTNPDTGRVTQLDLQSIAPFRPGRNTTMELWYVDQEASVWIDGDRVSRVPFDPPMSVLEERDRPASLPDIAIEVAGAPVTLHNVELDRDLYYGSWLRGSSIGIGGAVHRDGGRVDSRPVQLRNDEFYCLGDNSPHSQDSRYWTSVHPWVRETNMGGEVRQGVVPRDLMIGRAFYVYFPAPYPWRPGAPGIFPNFGAMRIIH